MRRPWQNLLVALGYAGVSFAYFGWRLLAHPDRVTQGAGGEVLIWSFAWWEHALATLSNPLVTHAIDVPYGANIVWSYTAPGLGLLFAPLTALAGPVVAFNVAYFLAPAASAWTAFLLARYLTGSLWASIIAGYLFGFSDAVLRQVYQGSLNLSAVFLFPLIALVIVRFVRGDLGGRGLAWRLGLLVAFQLTISTEFLLLVSVAVVVCLALAYAFYRQLRPRIVAALVPVAGGYALSLLFALPFVYYLLADYRPANIVPNIKVWGTDLLAPFVPNSAIGLGGNDLPGLTEHVSSRSAYLGLPLVAIIALYAVQALRTPTGRFLVAAFGLAFVLTLGATLQVYGHTLFTLPWWTAAAHVPSLRNVLPFRLGILEALAASMIVAVWTASAKGLVFKRPYVLPLLACVALVPALTAPSDFIPRTPQRLTFFTTGLYRNCIAPGETIAFFSGSDVLLWQAETGFRFKLAGGSIQPTPLNRFFDDPVVRDLAGVSTGRPVTGRLLAFAATHGVDRVVSLRTGGFPTRSEMRAFGPTSAVADVYVAPACGAPSLRTRDLGRFVARWEENQPPYERRPQVDWCSSSGLSVLPEGLVPLPGAHGTVANYVAGTGITCASPPPGYRRHGFAAGSLGVTPGVYPYWST